MSVTFRLSLMLLMLTALVFGFLHLFVTGTTLYNFERLHIFLFNLCSGGTVLLYYTEGRKRLSVKVILFLMLAMLYAVLAFLKIYLPAVIISVILAVIVDSVRINKFSILPVDFFNPRIPVHVKFHQAALLCLSIGLVISGLVILNNEYLGVISYDNLELDTFFLGFSFPVSLITLAVIFSFMESKDTSRSDMRKKNLAFWTINLGVIIFFLFIMFERLALQLAITMLLLGSVILIYFLYKNLGASVQQKRFLTSGLFFLWYATITGIVYIILEFDPHFSSQKLKFLLRMHTFASLYGWNFSGLAVICRQGEFPIQFHSTPIITLHWVTAIILAPLGTYFRFFAVCTLATYAYILYILMFSRGGSQCNALAS